MAVMARMAPHPISLPYALALPNPSNRDATTPSPCCAPHFMTQERLMFSNPTPSEPHLSPAATMPERRHTVGSHSALALRLYPTACNPSSSCRFRVLDHLAPVCLNRFTFAESRKPIFESLCVFYLSLV